MIPAAGGVCKLLAAVIKSLCSWNTRLHSGSQHTENTKNTFTFQRKNLCENKMTVADSGGGMPHI